MANNPYNGNELPPMIMVGDVIVHSDLLTEYFCCDIASCHGRCCEEGDAGAPVTVEEIADIEEQLDHIWPQLSASAQAVIDKQGVAYADPEGELVTSIVGGRDCAFRGPCGCLLKERPISCHLYPIRVKDFGTVTGIQYHRWNICEAAVRKGRELQMPVYKFLREPLIRRFGEDWYTELEEVANTLLNSGTTA